MEAQTVTIKQGLPGEGSLAQLGVENEGGTSALLKRPVTGGVGG